MLDIAVRLLAGFFANHPVHGVNPITQTLPRNVFGVPNVQEEAPPLVLVCNDADDKSVALELIAPGLPALIVWGEAAVDTSLHGYKIAKEVIICAAFVTSDKADALTAVRNCGFVMRGTRLSCGRYNSQEKAAGYRELNGIKIHELSSVHEHRVTAAQGRQKMWGYLDIRATVVETFL